MRKYQVILVDDIDGSEAAKTVQFAYSGKEYEIELSEENIARLEEALEPFISNGRRVTSKRGGGRGRRGGAPSRSAQIREWAREQGIPVPDRGRIPNDVMKQFEEAH